MVIFDSCPVCSVIGKTEVTSTPYFKCEGCGLYYQPEMGDKVYEGEHEIAGNLMSEADKQANSYLASQLYNHLSKLKHPSYTHLDIGSKYPYLGHCLQKLGPVTSLAMDGIEEGPSFGEELEVEMLHADFEKEHWEITDTAKNLLEGKVDLLTLVHCFEHFYKPLKALKRLRSLIKDDGILFIRSPDSGVPGIERDFTPGHYSIHPVIWSQSAFYEALYQTETFTVTESYPLGGGQRDYLLKPLLKKPEIWAGYIAKNEERDLPASLDSIASVVAGVCVVDTGSTDKTLEVIKGCSLPSITKICTTYSTQEDGDWKLWSFGLARNEYIQRIEKETDADFILWMDADDTLSPEAAAIIKRAPYMPYDIHGFQIKTGLDSHLHHRLWRTHKGVTYQGACHEYPQWPATFRTREWPQQIVHNYEPGSGESSILRNLRILKKEHEEGKSDSRTLFYLANSHRDAGGVKDSTENFTQAISLYTTYIKLGSSYHDELMFCYIYKARCQRMLGQQQECLKTVREGLAKDPSFAELYMEASYASTDNWQKISWALQVLPLKFQQRLFAERNKYEDQPLRTITHSFNAIGFHELAKSWGKMVLDLVPHDTDWKQFLGEIGEPAKVINLLRPGALGDVLMTASVVPGLRKKYPQHKIYYYTKCLEMASAIKGVEVKDSSDWASRSNGLDFSLTGYPLKEGYPRVPLAKHLTDYFCEEVGVEKLGNGLKKRLAESPYSNHISIHVDAGWSHYKEWPRERWETIIAAIKKKYNNPIIQIGGPNDKPLMGVDVSLLGGDLLLNTEVIKSAKLHLGVDSFSNHVAGLYLTPAVILFGSTSPVGSGYPTATNLWLDLACSPCYKENPEISEMSGGPCTNPPEQKYGDNKHLCMSDISENNVLEAILEILPGERLNMRKSLKELL